MSRWQKLFLKKPLRWHLSPYVGFTYKNMVLGASYDVNISDLGKMVNGTNSFEISLTFFGKKSVKTPEAEFICPAL